MDSRRLVPIAGAETLLMPNRLFTKIRAWIDLVRLFNIPIPLAAMLVGAYAVPAGIGWHAVGLVLCAILGCAATQAFNDYEDRQVDKENASFRPIPSGRLSPREVLVGGYLCTFLFAGVAALMDPWAALVVGGVFLCTRYYSRLKQSSLIHHFALPAALGLLPVLGSLAVHNQVLPLALIAGVSIFLIDINMNVIGAFKDLWDDSVKECVLPVVWGARPAILFALAMGIAGIVLQMAAIPMGFAGGLALLPLALGLILTIHSRLALLRKPCAKVGYMALKSGRLTECLTFPALLLGVLPPLTAIAIIATLTLLALCLQTLIPEAKLPKAADTPLACHGC